MRTLIFFLFAFAIASTTFAQRDIDEYAEQSFKDRGFVGFGFGGLGFGSDTYYGKYFSVGVSALTGYMLTPHLSTGVGVEYQYTNYSDLHYKNNLYVGYPFLRYNIKNFFIQTDYDFYSLNVQLTTDRQRRLYERFFIGLGYASPMGERGKFNILFSYDLLYPNSYVFSSPINSRLFFTF